MLNIFKLDSLRSALEKAKIWIAVLVMAAIGLTPFILQGSASAAQLTDRTLTISSSADGATTLGQNVTYTFDFNLATAHNVGSIEIDFCTQPLGTCTTPTNMSVGTAALNTATDTVDGGDGAFTGGGFDANTLQITSSSPVAGGVGDAVHIEFTGVRNPDLSGNGTSFYARITTSSDTGYATDVDDGVVAGAIVDQLTVTGRVQERLVFCVYALDDAAASNTTAGTGNGEQPTSCAANEANNGADVDIGVIDNLDVYKSPIDNSPPSSIGNDTFGAAQINTNAPNGVALTYYATAASTGSEELRAFRVPGATCTNGGADTTDQCFISADSSTGETFTPGTERFGIQIACVANLATAGSDLGSTSNLGAGGSGNGTAGTYNAVYSNVDDNVDDDGGQDCENTDGGEKFGWNDTSTAQALISSGTVVDDEIVKMRFGATAAATTPTGLYTAATTMIATATF